MKESPHKLDAAELNRVLAILQREQEVNPPSRRQLIVFKLFRLAVYGLGIAGLVIPVVSAVYVSAGESIYDIVFFTTLFGLLIASPFAIVITILFGLNLPLVQKLRNQNRLRRELGLTEALSAPWRAERKRHKLRHFLTRIVSVFGLFFILAGGILALQGGSLLMYFLFVPILILVGVSLFAAPYVIRDMERWEVVTRLQTVSSEYGKQAEEKKEGPIDISSDWYERIAQIERVQISRDRIKTLEAYREAPEVSTYLVQKSRSVRDALAHLDDRKVKYHVHDHIDALTMDPRPPEATEDPKTHLWSLPVPDTDYEIGYTIDEESSRVKVYFLKNKVEDGSQN